MPDRADALPSHRNDEPFEVSHRGIPGVVPVRRGRAVAMPSLIVAVHVADRAQALCKRAIYSSEKSGRVQDYDRPARATPIQRMQPNAVDLDETGARFRGLWAAFHERNQRCASEARMSSRVIDSSISRRAFFNFEIRPSTRGSLSRASSSASTEQIASARTMVEGWRARNSPWLARPELGFASITNPPCFSPSR